MTALIGVATSVPIKNLEEESTKQSELEQMSSMCNVAELAQIDIAEAYIQLRQEEGNEAEADEDADVDADADADAQGSDSDDDKKKKVYKKHGIHNWVDNTKGSEKSHSGKTRNQILKANKKILDTQQKCLDFVSQNPDHPEVCKWCSENQEPSNPWLWNAAEGVWYKWWGSEFHYWGANKDGRKHDWSWYKGYWHHDGYSYKYENNKWSRFQGN